MLIETNNDFFYYYLKTNRWSSQLKTHKHNLVEYAKT